MVAREFPQAEHRICARHVFANWHKSYKGDEMKILFWRCAKSYNEADFNEAFDDLKEADPSAAEAFLACNPTLFCRAFIDKHSQSDVIVSNMSETFNSYIISARSKHLIYMLEEIRTQIMQRLVEKKLKMKSSSDVVCPRVQDRLDKEKEIVALCKVTPSSTTLFQVLYGGDPLKVDLEGKTCTCKKWDLTGIPCAHAIASINIMRDQAETYVSDYYKREAYLQSYNLNIAPVDGQRYWPKRDIPLNPPAIKVGPGRPRKNRRKDPHEDVKKKGRLTKHGVEMTCSIYKQNTHNKRKCPDKDKPQGPPPPKKSYGRPRKYPRVETSTTPSQAHHDTTAQPARLGKGGRVIKSKGGGRKGGGRRGKGAKTTTPEGFGVLIDGTGNIIPNVIPSAPSSIQHSNNEGALTQMSSI